MISFLISALVAVQPTPATIDRRPPIDQCAADRSFVAFRESLRRAIRRRDRRYILSVLVPDVGVSMGGARGRQDFIDLWYLNRSDSLLWESLEGALSLGCARLEGGEFVAPSMVAQL